MCKENVILKILEKTYDFLTYEQEQTLKYILEEELNNYDLSLKTNAIIPYQGLQEELMLFMIAKKIEGLSDQTLHSYKLHLMNFFKCINKKVKDINVMDIRRYLALSIQSGHKNSTVATETWTLRSFFNWLEQEDYISKSPMRKIKAIKKPRRLKEFLTQEELEKLRIACKTLRQKAEVEVFYSTACRVTEICQLNISDIDWVNGKINVIGKGDSQRVVFLNAKATVHLKNYLNSRIDNNNALFVSERCPYNRIGKRAFEEEFHKLGIKAGIDKSVYPHIFRHSSATAAINNGMELHTVQLMLGHKDPSTTQVYAKLNINEIQASHKKCVI